MVCSVTLVPHHGLLQIMLWRSPCHTGMHACMGCAAWRKGGMYSMG